ncbi:sugar ABC transporter substrate-binding protein [Cohnella sp. JJ-181]|uniref:sugar ABC transporter substrate-binding protein n=1 Tax=Cohnella rhizoplanae TaxID=2974897 RepID=UPI0022FF5D39|nr:substrate-binding domain-containing protein [Cohnella sp. JJ-181]CAI6080745.1 Ribose import binding protein RbsB [Cohnella sp. JJ-181]
MRKSLLILIGALCAVLLYFTAQSADRVFRSERQLPRTPVEQQARYRLVLITQELETPFWDKVAAGAKAEALASGAAIEVWGSYGKDQEDFLKKLEIAIDAKVDGIIVQGLDSDAFKNLTKVKAAFYGIPVITVGSDVPMVDSLRRTYVGSDQYAAGGLIAKQLIADMGKSGTVILLGDSREEYYQQQRLKGIYDILKAYPGVKTAYAETADTREQVIATTQDMMNRLPDVDAFVAVNANIAAAMIHEIGRRSQVEPYDIYSFDDSPDSLPLLEQGKLDGVLEQSPDKMGRAGVNLMVKWLSGEVMPLNTDGYPTEIKMLKLKEAP